MATFQIDAPYIDATVTTTAGVATTAAATDSYHQQQQQQRTNLKQRGAASAAAAKVVASNHSRRSGRVLATGYHNSQPQTTASGHNNNNSSSIGGSSNKKRRQQQLLQQQQQQEEQEHHQRQHTTRSAQSRSQRSKTRRLVANCLSRIDSVFIMMTMLVVVTVVISGNAVFAAQRDSFKPKDPNSISNNANTIPNGMGNSGSSNSNENGSAASGGNTNNISNGNTNANSNGGTSTSTSASSAAGSSSGSASGATITTSTTTTTSTKSTTTTSSSSSSSSSSSNGNSQQQQQQQQQKVGSSSGASASGASGINRNTIEVLAEDTRNGPYFDKAASKNITALLGKTAYLNCRVKNLGNKTMLLQVSWVRHRDIHLLTVGRYTYTSDQRFRAIHQPQTEDWILQIKYPQHRDSGIYECQVSTTPHMSHYIHLHVVEPSTQIIGAPDLYIESGSTINLTCVIQNSPEPPAYIFWNHNNAIINYDSPRGGVSVVTNKGETTTSFLLIKAARPSDSGHYQCNPSNAKPISVTVHVLNGEFPAAMQRAGQSHHRMTPAQYLLVCLSVYLCTLAYARRSMRPRAADAATRYDSCGVSAA